MIIILEGCDKTGKTTLAKKLCKKFKLDYVKVSNPKGDPYKEYIGLINSVKKPTLFDRFHLGEEVYGPLVRGKSQLSKVKFKHIENELKKKDAIIIYTYNSIKFISQKFREDKETFVKIKDISLIKKLYEDVLKITKIPVLKFKIGDNEKELFSLIK